MRAELDTIVLLPGPPGGTGGVPAFDGVGALAKSSGSSRSLSSPPDTSVAFGVSGVPTLTAGVPGPFVTAGAKGATIEPLELVLPGVFPGSVGDEIAGVGFTVPTGTLGGNDGPFRGAGGVGPTLGGIVAIGDAAPF